MMASGEDDLYVISNRGRALSQSSQHNMPTTHYGSIDSHEDESRNVLNNKQHEIVNIHHQHHRVSSSNDFVHSPSMGNMSINDDGRPMTSGKEPSPTLYYYSSSNNNNQVNDNNTNTEKRSTVILNMLESVILTVGFSMSFGSIIRFPYLVHQFEGGAFFIPYIVLLIIIGAPLVILDFTLGSIARQSIVFSLGRWNRRASGIGMAAVVFGSLIIASYYSVITSWIAVYFGYVFKEQFPWSDKPETFFHDEILHLSDHSFDISGFLSWPVLVSLVCFWFITYWLVFAHFINRFARVIISLLSLSYFVVMVVVLVRVLFQNGASLGLLQLFRPKWSLLIKGDLWLGAFGQLCFTYGVANGALSIHASHYKTKKDTVLTSWTIIFFGLLFSLISGLTYYASLGYLSTTKTSPYEINSLFTPAIASPLFVMIEVVSRLFPTPQIFVFILLLSLIFVGFNSIIYFVESLIDIVKNQIPRRNTRRLVVSIIVVCLVCIIGIPFTLSNGYYILEIVDHYVGNYGMGMIAMMECIMIGWFSSNQDGGVNRKKKKKEIRKNRPATYWFSMCQYFSKRWNQLRSEKNWNNFKQVCFFSIEHVRERFAKETSFGPYMLWSLSIKYIGPFILFTLFVWNIVTECIQPFSTNHRSSPDGKVVYEYDILSLVLGWMLVVSCLFVFIIFGVWPSVKERDEVGGDQVKEFANSLDSSLKQPLYSSYSDFGDTRSEISSNIDLDTQD